MTLTQYQEGPDPPLPQHAQRIREFVTTAGKATEHLVTGQPSDLQFVARHGEPLMRAAQRNGLKWPTVCQGNGRCGTCRVRIVSAEVTLPPTQPREESALRRES